MKQADELLDERDRTIAALAEALTVERRYFAALAEHIDSEPTKSQMAAHVERIDRAISLAGRT